MSRQLVQDAQHTCAQCVAMVYARLACTSVTKRHMCDKGAHLLRAHTCHVHTKGSVMTMMRVTRTASIPHRHSSAH
jgi:hypothetical protein